MEARVHGENMLYCPYFPTHPIYFPLYPLLLIHLISKWENLY